MDKGLFVVEWDAKQAFGETLKEQVEDLYMVILRTHSALGNQGVDADTLVAHPEIAAVFDNGCWPWAFPWWKEGRHHYFNFAQRWRFFYDSSFSTDIITVGNNTHHATIQLINFQYG